MSDNKRTRAGDIFTPPTLEQVIAYCMERENGIDAEHWYDYYLSNGWHVGRVKMKDWRAAVRTWEKKNGTNRSRGFRARTETQAERNARRLREEQSLIAEQLGFGFDAPSPHPSGGHPHVYQYASAATGAWTDRRGG